MTAPSRRRWLRHALTAVVFVAAIVFLTRTAGDVGFHALAARLSGASRPLLAATVAITLARYAIWGSRWQLLARPVARIGWLPAQRGLLYSLFVTTVVPASRAFGGILRGQHAARVVGTPAAPLVGAAIVDQFGYSTVSMILGAAFIPAAVWGGGGRQGDGSSWSWGIAAALLGPILYLFWRHRAFLLERLRRRIPQVTGSVGAAVAAIRALLALRSTWAVMAVGGVMVWGVNVVTYQVAAASLGVSLPFSGAAVAFSLGSLAGTITGTPGGAGTTEAAALAPLLALGIPADQALALILLARGVHYIGSLSLGGACALLAPKP